MRSSEEAEASQEDANERNAKMILGGLERYTLVEAAQLAGLTQADVVRFWSAMGFPTVSQPETSRIFTEDDVNALREQRALLEDDDITPDTLESLTRAQSHMSDRLVLWQHEVLVDYARNNLGMDAVSARFWVLKHMVDYQEHLRFLMEYSWGRHMVALLRRSQTEATEMENSEASGVMLQRAFGFIDMVAFTIRSNELGSADFIDLIESFDATCRSVISAAGARVVKSIGDAFLYICDDVATGAEVATEIIEQLHKVEGMLPVRASLVWGSVVSRFGDIFGPKVNLASRLVDAAEAGTILVDGATAEAIRVINRGRYTLVPVGAPHLQGFGAIDAVELRRMPSQ